MISVKHGSKFYIILLRQYLYISHLNINFPPRSLEWQHGTSPFYLHNIPVRLDLLRDGDNPQSPRKHHEWARTWTQSSKAKSNTRFDDITLAIIHVLNPFVWLLNILLKTNWFCHSVSAESQNFFYDVYYVVVPKDWLLNSFHSSLKSEWEKSGTRTELKWSHVYIICCFPLKVPVPLRASQGNCSTV